MKRVVAPLLLVLAVTSLPGPTGAEDPLKALDLIKPGQARLARDFTLSTPNNGSLRLADLRGRVVFLNFWATWCPPCREELPGMERLYQKHRAKGLVVVGLSMDSDGASVVTPFLKEHRLTFPVGLDPKMTVASLYGVRALPSTFIIDRSGHIASIAIGPRDWDGKASHALFESMLR